VAEQQRLVLRILAGPNAGAEAALGGRTVVGSAETADITIGDAQLAPEHFTIIQEKNATSVVVGDAPITLKGEMRRNGTFPLAPFDIIKFGATACAIGPEGGTFPTLTAADLLPAPAPPADSPPAGAPPAAEEGVPKLEKVVPTRMPVLEVKPPRRGRARPATIVGAALLVVAVLCGGVYLLLGSERAQELVLGDDLAAAQKIVEAQQAKGVTVRRDEQGDIAAEGFVATSDQQRRLRLAFAAANLPVKSRIVNLEQQVTAIRTIVATAGAQLTVEPDVDTGKIVISGFLPETSYFETLQRVLTRDIPDLRPIEARIVTPEKAVAEARRRLAAAGLEGVARVETAGATVRIAGTLPEAGRTAVRGIVEGLNKQWSGALKIEDATTTGSSQAVTVQSTAPPEKITIVVAGPEGFVRDNSGRRYVVGDRLANGEVIEEIRVDEIVTTKNGVKYRYTFGGR
jgi:type III secretion system YscD/HrpQ family protein